MRRIILLLIIVTIIIAIYLVYIYESENYHYACTDMYERQYLEKQYEKLPHMEKRGLVVAVEGGSCKPNYLIKSGNAFREVSILEFEKYIEDYNKKCGNCLISEGRSI